MSAASVRAPGRVDFWILIPICALTIAGLIAVYSASFVVGAASERGSNYYIYRQVLWAAVGTALAIVLMNISTERLRALAGPAICATILALAAVMVMGYSVNGAQRWIGYGIFSVQPAEYAKFTLVLFLGAWLGSRTLPVMSSGEGLLGFLFWVGTICGLIMAQPSLGTTLIIGATSLTMLWMRGFPVTRTLALISAGLLLVSLFVITSGYRTERFTSSAIARAAGLGAAEPNPDDRFQIDHAVSAIGNGGLEGIGIGASRGKFFYIPESHTDGIFAVVGEETGFIGTMSIIVLFVIVAGRGYQVAQRAAGHPFPHLVAIGITTWFIVQAILNIGGITDVLPLTGVPLPFLSYGGNALAAELMAVGALLRISREFPPPRPGRPIPATANRGPAQATSLTVQGAAR